MLDPFRRPVFPVVLGALGIGFAVASIQIMSRGSVRWIRQDGPAQVFSPSDGALWYYVIALGMLSAGVLLVVFACVLMRHIFILIRRGDIPLIRWPNVFGLIMFGIGLLGILLAIILR